MFQTTKANEQYSTLSISKLLSSANSFLNAGTISNITGSGYDFFFSFRGINTRDVLNAAYSDKNT